MSTNKKPFWRSRLWMPLFSLLLGLLILAASWIGDKPSEGLKGLLVMTLVGALFLVFGGRSETLAGIGGPRRDERWAMIDLRASWFAGTVMIACTLGAWLYELARGRDGEPYAQLAAVAGVSYLIAVAVLRWRA